MRMYLSNVLDRHQTESTLLNEGSMDVVQSAHSENINPLCSRERNLCEPKQ